MALPLPFKFDVSRLKAKIDEVEDITKKTFHATVGVGAMILGVGERDSKKENKTQYYMELISDSKPSLTEEEFLKITPEGFFDPTFDTTQFILDLLPPNVGNNSAEFSTFLDTNVKQFSRAMDYVNSRLYNRVRENYTEFVQGMSQIHEIGVELQRSTVMCSNGRRTLAQTKKNLTSTAFIIMSKYTKRNLLQRMYVDLSQIREIVHLERLLKQTLSDGDYPSTIKYYLECRKTITQHLHYNCVPDLDKNLQEIYHVVQERIDKDFFNSCRDFNSTTYQRVFQAYKLLGRANKILDRLQTYFVDPIEPETRNIVYSHVLLSEENVINPERIKGLSYKELCKELKDEHFINCLLAVFEYLCDVMTSLYLMNQFHIDNRIHEGSKIFEDINSALTRFKNTIWDTMQKQVTHLLAPRKLSNFKIDDFLLVLNSVTKISEIGEEFSGHPSHKLKQLIINQSKTYLDNFHCSRIEDLRTVLENESWTSIPVDSTFNAKVELRLHKKSKVHTDRLHGDHLFQSIKTKGNPFSQLISYKKNRLPSTHTSPTIKSQPNNSNNNNAAVPKVQAPSTNGNKIEIDSDDENEELKQEYIQEDMDSDEEEEHKKKKQQQQQQQSQQSQQQQQQEKIILVSSATIGFVRNIGKYLEMMEMLPHISTDIFNSICQLVEYYMYTVYSFSGYLDPQGFSLEALTTKIEKTISERQFEDLSFTKPHVSKFINKMKERVGLPPTSIATSTASTVMSGISGITNITNMNPLSTLSNQFSLLNTSIKNIASNINSPSLSANNSSNNPYSNNIPPMNPTPTTISNSTPSSTSQPQDQPLFKWIPARINYLGLQLGDPEQLFNLPVRMVAIESLSFIAEALNVCRPVFENLLPPNQTDSINEFYNNIIEIIPGLQGHLVKCTISAVFTHQASPQFFSNTIANNKWDVKVGNSTKSPYVDAFVKEFTKLFAKLDRCVQQANQYSDIPVITRSLRNRIVELSFEYFIQQLVDGYSKIRKCTNEGRASMIQDVMSLKYGLEKISNGVKIPNISYAEEYIKAFYLLPAIDDQAVIEWTQTHDEYPIRYIINLLNLVKVSKPQLFSQLEEMDRKRRNK
ncbi:hypothetical protein DICPUDRAFT_147568 [Dictyostelium purpureum]|uniref:Uncharacterized protein n=1 Tax=Dictyostelium purpureum TaxID=5786 RepID=F0Z8U3_DICPU|nr:uncharacterized protein DICPUDRAFT_147568 [Dictyostelium purpureum]EGC39635.1 hypothetical protein DICPUDRAFT_147568 [Dictyostelium purpureum]|eukprot:XP_003283856.1 hypothetical protein DICPUDRAFT_147568 [Dictyostelium purpureum]